jgi:cell division protein FtsZ
LGAGGDPEKAREYAEESIDKIKKIFSDETEMVFITAGMGGGTGTGASSVVARVARELNILTIGIVTIPFVWEGDSKIFKALKGVEEVKKNVDALLVINNESLQDRFPFLSVLEAFKKADDTLLTAVRSISEIITIPGYINLDFADVKTILKDGGVAIMSSGLGRGDNRVSQAIENARNSPLLNNNDIFNAKKILLNISFGNAHPMMMEELNEIKAFMAKFDSDIEVIWGTALDDSLDDQIKIAILASGFGSENIVSPETMMKARRELTLEEQKEKEKQRLYEEKLKAIYYPDTGKNSSSRPFIFTPDNIDDNETIEAVINNPAHNRSSRVMIEIARKAEARKKEIEEPAV